MEEKKKKLESFRRGTERMDCRAVEEGPDRPRGQKTRCLKAKLPASVLDHALGRGETLYMLSEGSYIIRITL